MKSKLFSKSLAVLMALSLMLSVIVCGPISATTVNSDDVWKGDVASGFADNSTGTADDPILISTPEELAYLVKGNSKNNNYYKLTNDIYLNDVTDPEWYKAASGLNEWYGWSDITNGITFSANFDGDGYTIYGLYNVSDTATQVGLFPRIGGGGAASVYNLNISDVYIRNNNNAGSVAGFAPAACNSINIYNCSVVNVDIEGKDGAAGYIGWDAAKASAFSNCSFEGVVNATNKGAFVGQGYSNITVTINNSYAIGAVFSSTQAVTRNNCYGTETETGVTKVSAEDMKGDAAKASMPNLGWYTWATVENDYPAPVIGYAGGTGTQADPYLIANAAQMAMCVSSPTPSAAVYYKLIADIYLNDTTSETWYTNENNLNWYSGTGKRFWGELDGNGYTVYGLYYKNEALTSATNVSLIPCVTGSATIKNLTVSDVYIYMNHTTALESNAAALVSYTICNTNIDKCVVKNANITVLNSTSGGSAVGFATYGEGRNVTISNSAFIGELTATGTTNCAAFIGNYWSGGTFNISNSYAVGAKLSCKTFGGSNNYGTEETGEAQISADTIKGENAKTNMPNLDWYTWKTVENDYPVPARYGYAGGEGTADSPYVIDTAEDFEYLVSKEADSSGRYFILGADIAVTKEKWFDSTNVAANFAGTFDGNGHTVSGINYTGEATANLFVGLFPKVAGATIKNLVLTDSSISLTSKTTNYDAGYVGGIIGYMYGDVTIENTVITESVSLSNHNGEGGNSKARLGGFIGGGEKGGYDINGCQFLGALSYDEGDRYGAFIGDVWHSPATAYIRNSLANVVFTSKYDFNGANNFANYADGTEKHGITECDSFTACDLGTAYAVGGKYPSLKVYALRHGDANGDYKLDASDVTAVRQFILSDTACAVTDFTQDGKTDIRDLVLSKKILNGYDNPLAGEETELLKKN